MAISQAVVQTEMAARYLGQFCRHFAHWLKVEYGPERPNHGRVEFMDSGLCLLNAGPGELTLWVEADDPAMLERLEHVVTSHLARFAFRDNPPIDWTRRGSMLDEALSG